MARFAYPSEHELQEHPGLADRDTEVDLPDVAEADDDRDRIDRRSVDIAR